VIEKEMSYIPDEKETTFYSKDKKIKTLYDIMMADAVNQKPLTDAEKKD
jgi:hypothetical protein